MRTDHRRRARSDPAQCAISPVWPPSAAEIFCIVGRGHINLAITPPAPVFFVSSLATRTHIAGNHQHPTIPSDLSAAETSTIFTGFAYFSLQLIDIRRFPRLARLMPVNRTSSRQEI